MPADSKTFYIIQLILAATVIVASAYAQTDTESAGPQVINTTSDEYSDSATVSAQSDEAYTFSNNYWKSPTDNMWPEESGASGDDDLNKITDNPEDN